MMHFRISNGTIQATNGNLAVQCPFPSDLDCCPHAGQFIKAIAACEDVVSMHIEKGKLYIKSGKFKTSVHLCETSTFPTYTPAGQMFPVPLPILPILKKLLPFISEDDRRPWACGVQFSNNSAIATNSIAIVEHWLPVAFPVVCNIPRDAIAELIRLKIEPVAIQANPYGVIFHLPENAWFACSVLKFDWPDVGRVFDNAEAYAGEFLTGEALNILLEDVSKLEDFTNETKAVAFHPGRMSTVAVEPETTIDCPHSPGVGVYRADSLSALRGIVDKVGFAAYPFPVPFYGGDLLRGVIAGYK